MNGRVAKKLRRTAPMVLYQAAQNIAEQGGNMNGMPTVRQVYCKLKKQYKRASCG